MSDLAFVHRALVDPRFGIVRMFNEYPRLPTCSDLFMIGAESNDATYFDDFGSSEKNDRAPVAGAGLSRTEAMWAVLGEAIERYTTRIDPETSHPGRLIAGTAHELGSRAVNLTDFILYGDAQYSTPGFPFARPDPAKRRRWVETVEIGSGEMRHVPAQLAWLGLTCQSRDEMLAQPLSSGLATGQSVMDAQLRGALEVIERDAFMATWLLRRPPPRLSLSDALMEQLDPRLIPLLRHPYLRTTLLLLTTDVAVPVVLALVRSGDGTRSTVGAAAHPDWRIAIRKAVIEAQHSWAWLLNRVAAETPTADQIRTFEHHCRFYGDPRNQHFLEFLEAGPLVDPPAALAPEGTYELLRFVIAALRDRGLATYFADLTTPDVSQLGLVVGRTLVPGLHPIGCSPRFYPLDDRRLRNLAAAWSFEMPQALNLEPHPFP